MGSCSVYGMLVVLDPDSWLILRAHSSLLMDCKYELQSIL